MWIDIITQLHSTHVQQYLKFAIRTSMEGAQQPLLAPTGYIGYCQMIGDGNGYGTGNGNVILVSSQILLS